MTNLFIILLEIIIGLTSAYLIYYVRKKGQNQADKEDLKNLTVIVEDVKMKNSKEIESIKANLSLLTDRSKQIFSEEKDSIIVFFAQLNTWIWGCLNVCLNDYNALKSEDIPRKLIELKDAYNKTNVAYAKVTLIINDKVIVETGREAINKTFDLHELRENILIKLHGNFQNLNKVNEDIADFKDEYMPNPSTHIDTLIAFSNSFDINRIKLITDNNGRYLVLFDTAMEAVNAFKDSAQKYLRKENPTN